MADENGVIRPETGPVKFGEDWPGIFLRGKDAFFYLQAVEGALATLPAQTADPLNLVKQGLKGLADLLRSSDVREKAEVQQLPAEVGKFGVAVCPEGDFEDLEFFETEAEADAYANGVISGAGHYGAGEIHTFTLPTELDELKNPQGLGLCVDEDVRAKILAAWKKRGKV